LGPGPGAHRAVARSLFREMLSHPSVISDSWVWATRGEGRHGVGGPFVQFMCAVESRGCGLVWCGVLDGLVGKWGLAQPVHARSG
jgi:hypothetical protein